MLDGVADKLILVYVVTLFQQSSGPYLALVQHPFSCNVPENSTGLRENSQRHGVGQSVADTVNVHVNLSAPQDHEYTEPKYYICTLFLPAGVQIGTVFAYGATGAGKTYTMSGREQVLGPGRGPGRRLRAGARGRLPPRGGVSDGTEGLVPRSMRYLFQQISALSSEVTMRIRASFYEIYNEVVYDLLTQNDRRPLQVICACNHYAIGTSCALHARANLVTT